MTIFRCYIGEPNSINTSCFSETQFSAFTTHPLLLNCPFNLSPSWILNCPWRNRMVLSTTGSSPSYFKAQLWFKFIFSASISPSHSSPKQIHGGDGVAKSLSCSGMLSTEWMFVGGILHHVAPATVKHLG